LDLGRDFPAFPTPAGESEPGELSGDEAGVPFFDLLGLDGVEVEVEVEVEVGGSSPPKAESDGFWGRLSEAEVVGEELMEGVLNFNIFPFFPGPVLPLVVDGLLGVDIDGSGTSSSSSACPGPATELPSSSGPSPSPSPGPVLVKDEDEGVTG
jgi:hypothetical protein